jgi:hypothetical protein
MVLPVVIIICVFESATKIIKLAGLLAQEGV